LKEGKCEKKEVATKSFFYIATFEDLFYKEIQWRRKILMPGGPKSKLPPKVYVDKEFVMRVARQFFKFFIVMLVSKYCDGTFGQKAGF
jgi:hypothetical protein